MKAILNPWWEITDELPDSRHGDAVLVHRSTRETFGPYDALHVPSRNRNGSYHSAKTWVCRLLSNAQSGLSVEQLQLVGRFLEPEGYALQQQQEEGINA
jgi:hypothetical protein